MEFKEAFVLMAEQGKICINDYDKGKYRVFNHRLQFFQKIDCKWVDEWVNSTFVFCIVPSNWRLVEEKTLCDKALGYGKLMKNMNSEDYNFFSGKALDYATAKIYKEEDVKKSVREFVEIVGNEEIAKRIFGDKLVLQQ